MKTNYTQLMQFNWSPYQKNEPTIAVKDKAKHDDSDLKDIIQNSSKEKWFNIVASIKKMGYPRNKNAIHGLLFLLKDMNWPGADESFLLIKEMPRGDIKQPLQMALNQADKENDTVWIAGLRPLINHFNFTDDDFSNINLHKLLSKSEW
jgi:hypothetical protein